MSKFEIPSVGVGTARTPAAWIIIMLASEDDWMRPQIILKVMEHLGISIDALIECYNKYKNAAQQPRALDATDWACKSCGFTNHPTWRKCGNCETLRR